MCTWYVNATEKCSPSCFGANFFNSCNWWGYEIDFGMKFNRQILLYRLPVPNFIKSQWIVFEMKYMDWHNLSYMCTLCIEHKIVDPMTTNSVRGHNIQAPGPIAGICIFSDLFKAQRFYGVRKHGSMIAQVVFFYSFATIHLCELMSVALCKTLYELQVLPFAAHRYRGLFSVALVNVILCGKNNCKPNVRVEPCWKGCISKILTVSRFTLPWRYRHYR